MVRPASLTQEERATTLAHKTRSQDQGGPGVGGWLARCDGRLRCPPRSFQPIACRGRAAHAAITAAIAHTAACHHAYARRASHVSRAAARARPAHANARCHHGGHTSDARALAGARRRGGGVSNRPAGFST